MKQRWVNTKFWSDSFVVEKLNPLDRYLFLYFLTNERTNICGVYELPIAIIAFETGIEKETLQKMMKRLEPKVYYFGGWVILKNHQRHQNTGNSKIRAGIEAGLELVPKKVLEYAKKMGYGMTDDDSYMTHQETSHSDSDSDIDSDSDSDIESDAKTVTSMDVTLPKPSKDDIVFPTPGQIAKAFFDEKESSHMQYWEATLNWIVERGVPLALAERELNKFFDYWSERNKSGKKMKWELQKTFELNRRLATWFRNIEQFAGKINTQKVGKNYDRN